MCDLIVFASKVQKYEVISFEDFICNFPKSNNDLNQLLKILNNNTYSSILETNLILDKTINVLTEDFPLNLGDVLKTFSYVFSNLKIYEFNLPQKKNKEIKIILNLLKLDALFGKYYGTVRKILLHSLFPLIIYLTQKCCTHKHLKTFFFYQMFFVILDVLNHTRVNYKYSQLTLVYILAHIIGYRLNHIVDVNFTSNIMYLTFDESEKISNKINLKPLCYYNCLDTDINVFVSSFCQGRHSEREEEFNLKIIQELLEYINQFLDTYEINLFRYSLLDIKMYKKELLSNLGLKFISSFNREIAKLVNKNTAIVDQNYYEFIEKLIEENNIEFRKFRVENVCMRIEKKKKKMNYHMKKHKD